MLIEAAKHLVGMVILESSPLLWPNIVAYDGDRKATVYFSTVGALKDFLLQINARCGENTINLAFPEGHKYLDFATFKDIRIKKKTDPSKLGGNSSSRAKLGSIWRSSRSLAAGHGTAMAFVAKCLQQDDNQCLEVVRISGEIGTQSFEIKGDDNACEPL